MNAIALVGMTGSGKTFRSKEMIKKVNRHALLIFDVNKEYEEFYPYKFDPDMDNFLEKASRIRNGVVLIEDATSFFSLQGRSDSLIKLLIAKRHSNNAYILLFHAFADFPKYIYRKCTHIIIFKTPDAIHHLNAIGNDGLTAAWMKVQKECDGHKFFSTQPPPKGVIPPSLIYKV